LIELSVWDRFHYVDGWSVHSSFHELEGQRFCLISVSLQSVVEILCCSS